MHICTDDETYFSRGMVDGLYDLFSATHVSYSQEYKMRKAGDIVELLREEGEERGKGKESERGEGGRRVKEERRKEEGERGGVTDWDVPL